MGIVIVDYGLGNLFNLERAFRSFGCEVMISQEPKDLLGADKIVLPGVGAFGAAMANLAQRRLVEPLRSCASVGKPMLGICLGMQLMTDHSEEMGSFEGLGFVRGKVTALTRAEGIKIPQITWNTIDRSTRSWAKTVLDGLESGSFMYFVHSYRVQMDRPGESLAETTYGVDRFCSVFERENFYGCQFHPEKSAEAGLHLLRNFAARSAK